MKLKPLAAAVLLAGNFSYAAADMSQVLPNAKPGECYARVVIPAEYRNEASTVVVKEASERIKVIPAKYEWQNERVLVSEASSKYEVVPATFKTVKEEVETVPEESKWVTGSIYSSVEANPSLLSVAERAGVPIHSAQSGQCFAEYFEAPEYQTDMKQVLITEASENIEVIPPKYEWVEEQQMVSAASQKIIEVPAVYETVQEQIKLEDAKVVWKTGRGAIEKIDNASGEIMCLVEIPAKFKTVDKTLLKSAATSRVEEIPAKFQTVRVRKLVEAARHERKEIPARFMDIPVKTRVSDGRHVWVQADSNVLSDSARKTGNTICKKVTPAKMTTVSRTVINSPASVREVAVPAEYRDKRVQYLVSQASQTTELIPEETREITKRIKMSDARMEWRPVPGVPGKPDH